MLQRVHLSRLLGQRGLSRRHPARQPVRRRGLPSGPRSSAQRRSLRSDPLCRGSLVTPPKPPLGAGPPPDWAVGWGEDRFGVFADVAVGFVTQRMRWIPPGAFMMGSPPDEPGRLVDEGPQHRVELSQGFWLGDTPVTQALWQAVVGDNPSCFRSPTRPVEQVSWADGQGFCERLNRQVRGLLVRLPTEAEWEYACRAGTTTSTWRGPLEILGANNAPGLDAIAWYGGNSGVGFELDNGVDSSNWKEKQVAHERAGTRPVQLKLANPWGLYDMLGNVLEWCEDAYATYAPGPQLDPVVQSGPDRAVRGGSWLSSARYTRAACRGLYAPGLQDDDLGFRLAIGPSAPADE
ncbi:MAG: formylglycine-generating enzyme family protein [Alphaproteobacteria bacterium]|nr:formylglycine-generating enzyme family protein [Alphaproteobacteria bacterium]